MCTWLSRLFKKKTQPNMTLEKFVSESLIQICNGIRTAQKQISVTPLTEEDEKNFAPYIMPSPIGGREDEVSQINFDIAVTVEHTTSLSNTDRIAAKSQIYVVEGSVDLQNSDTVKSMGSSISRMQFSVPIIYPKMPYKY